MTLKLLMILGLVILGSYVVGAVHATDVSLNDSSYVIGETVIFSGTVEPGKFYTYQVFNPPADNFAHFSTFSPNSDGTFSDSFKADGAYWNLEGTYTLKLFDGPTIIAEIPFEYSLNLDLNPKPTTESNPKPTTESNPKPTTESNPKPTTESISEQESTATRSSESELLIKQQDPKTHVPGFPALDRSPQYYIDRYNDEASYHDWFDSQFPRQLIENVVGYEKTHVPGFPALDRSPQYYIDRYNDEASYHDWFDSQFPRQSIYNVLGFPDPIAVPDWIKNNAAWWSTGQINDDDFVSGIEFMIENDIIVIPNLPESQNSDADLPSWIRNTANWWSLDQISEDEFVNAIKYLIENGIIIV